MADKRCENGHFIDESWDLCPYCPAENAESDVPVVRPTRFGEPSRPVAVPPEPIRRPTAVPPSTMNRESAVAVADQPVERTIAVQKLDPLAAPKRYVVGWLIGLNGAARGESFPVRIGRNVLGRDRRSDIVVNDAEIEPRRDLAPKDVVRVGSHKYLFMPLCDEGFYWDEEGALK